MTDNDSPIYGGWGRVPLGFIPGDGGMECTFTDTQFDADLFMIAGTGTEVASTTDVGVLEADLYKVKTGPVVELPFECELASIKIDGLEATTDTTVETGKFKAAYADGKTTITLASADAAVGGDVQVFYRRRVVGSAYDFTTETSAARGELVITYPVMSAGKDCTEANVKAFFHIHVPRVKVTARPNLDASRGSAATPAITFSAIDSQRPDKRWYRVIFEPLSSSGAINTTYSTNVDYT